jgi:1-acyl-sn-glycerol-3-phosphate acyltransferase
MFDIKMLLRTLVTYFLIGLFGFFLGIPCLISASLPEQWRYNKLYYWCTDKLFKLGIWASFIPVTIEGKENIPHEPCIFAANHQSSFDIPLLGSLVDGHPHVWLFLKKYASVPIFGFIARRMNVVVDVSGFRKATMSIAEGIARVKGKDRHLLIFPEGGRILDDHVRDFFYGFAVIAKEVQRPVVPVMMINVNLVYPPGSFLVHYYPIKIIIGKPFFIEKDESLDDFVKRVHAWFANHTRVAE